jgi:hypothetical protein
MFAEFIKLFSLIESNHNREERISLQQDQEVSPQTRRMKSCNTIKFLSEIENNDGMLMAGK